MPKPTLKELIKDTKSYFRYCRDGELWYEIVKKDGYKEEVDIESRAYYEVPVYINLFKFPIPVSDMGTGIFYNEMKSILLMRWIRKHLDKWEDFNP